MGNLACTYNYVNLDWSKTQSVQFKLSLYGSVLLMDLWSLTLVNWKLKRNALPIVAGVMFCSTKLNIELQETSVWTMQWKYNKSASFDYVLAFFRAMILLKMNDGVIQSHALCIRNSINIFGVQQLRSSSGGCVTESAEIKPKQSGSVLICSGGERLYHYIHIWRSHECRCTCGLMNNVYAQPARWTRGQ